MTAKPRQLWDTWSSLREHLVCLSKFRSKHGSNEFRPIGPNTHLALQKLSDGLAAANTKFLIALQDAKVRLPSVRILKSGTFAAFRQWKAESMNVGPGQLKVPVVLLAESSRKWILEWVVGEL